MILEAGLAQRVLALNHFLDDVYGDARIIADGAIPARVIDLLVNDPLVPRSLCHAIERASAELQALPLGPGPTADARRLAQQAGTALRHGWPAGSTLEPREKRLRALQEQCFPLHELVMAAHVQYDVVGAPVH